MLEESSSKSRRNDDLPISKLPVELFMEIFLFHQQNMMQNDQTVLMLDWIGITHVCQLWREIALNFSGLWIHIPFHNPKWAKEMIERSRRACPIVNVSLRDPSVVQLLKSFL